MHGESGKSLKNSKSFNFDGSSVRNSIESGNFSFGSAKIPDESSENTNPEWKILLLLAKALNVANSSLPAISSIISERDLTLWLLKANQQFGGNSIKTLKSGVAIEGVTA